MRACTYEIDVLEGLEEIAREEIRFSLGVQDRAIRVTNPGSMQIIAGVDVRALLGLRSVIAVYELLQFDVPRPRALLGHQHFSRMSEAARQILKLHAPGSFRTLRLGAAGEHSSVLQRLRQELATQLGLQPVTDEGDLLLRLRRSEQVNGWDVLLRLSPRPLATRAWRVCNFPGAPNATLAHAIARLSEPDPQDRLLNICCGSGTLLVERLALTKAQEAIGCDIDHEALECARANLLAAGMAARVRLQAWDATALPLDTASINVILADLPFGQLIGSHRENQRLYPRLLSEAARVAAPGARMLLLTHELRLLEAAVADMPELWDVQQVLGVRSGGMLPRVFVMGRRT